MTRDDQPDRPYPHGGPAPHPRVFMSAVILANEIEASQATEEEKAAGKAAIEAILEKLRKRR